MENYDGFYGPNLGYVLELYDRYRRDPGSVEATARTFFETWTPPADLDRVSTEASTTDQNIEAVVSAANVAHAIRTYGHLGAHLDPLGSEPPRDPWLEASFHRISENDLRRLPSEVVGSPIAERAGNALEAIQLLREIYMSTIGYDYGHIRVPEERHWLRLAAEEGHFRPPNAPIDNVAVLERLTEVEALEHFLHRSFPGKTRFSIEGLDMMVPMIDESLSAAAEANICMIQIGMAHRGRINILAHILKKPYAQILAEFKDPGVSFSIRNELGWTGDVKYHRGAHSAVDGADTVKLVVSVPPNPSHLEHVNPVVMGMARAAGSVTNSPGPPEFFPLASLPIFIHGDASFPAQGIVSETLNFSRLPGYSVGGSLHIIANNQLGYTANQEEARSTLYASDLAKGYEIPIVHVNADDPHACVEAGRTAFAYRQKFGKDFLINLIGYRRYGHNEGDEPTFTQPLMYKVIERHPSVRKIWADKLVERGEMAENAPAEMMQARMNHLQQMLDSLQPEEQILRPQLEPPPAGVARRVKTGVSLEMLRELNSALTQVPEDFHLHRKIERGLKRRRDILDDPDNASVDWATAEELALATILAEGTPIRLTGEDTARGTFSQRHAVFHHVENGRTYQPLQALPQGRASFEVINSPLSENGALAFEFGYNIQSPKSLVIWEAQYGDFINAAQVIVDEFIASARPKWELTPSLVLLLPHGYEGQGPDHSSGRLERFLQLAAQTNMRIANCTTSAQYFHLLRRQAALLESDPLPLIVMTPKGLLRHPLVACAPRRFEEDMWQPVIDDRRARQNPETVRRLILCSGKIYIDLISSEYWNNDAPVAIVRLEQLYRFPGAELAETLEGYANLDEIVWVQEEPKNMGAWTFVQPYLLELIQGRWPLRYIGRIANASPAEGSAAWHAVNQRAIIQQACELHSDVLEEVGLVERD